MSFLYPRTIQIRRLRTEAFVDGVDQVGGLGYSGATQDTDESDVDGEQILFKNVCCQIAAHQSGRTKDGLLPTDATMKPLWLIIVPSSSCVPKAAIRDRDILVDDEQYRYIVAQAWWTPLSWNLSAVRLEA
jgi:hypothetical protein